MTIVPRHSLSFWAMSSDHSRVFTQQFQAGLTGPTAPAGCDNDGVGVSHLLNRRRPDYGRRIERGAVRQVHGFTFGDLLTNVMQQQFVRDARMQR